MAGSKLYAVKPHGKKLIHKSKHTGARYQSALTRYGVGENERKARGVPFGTKRHGATGFKALEVTPGKRTRGTKKRTITKDTRTVRERTGKRWSDGAHVAAGVGTGRKRSVTRVSKVPTGKVRRGAWSLAKNNVRRDKKTGEFRSR